MNTFELQIFDDEGRRCTFYTVKWEETDISETDKFLRKYGSDEKLQRSVQELAKFLEIVIGEENGALEGYFKNEDQANALPPTGVHFVGEITINYSNFPLRLYCLRISDSLVILFNGGEKTSETAKGGKTSMTFSEANLFAERILEALYQKEIYITESEREFRNFQGGCEIIL